MKQCFVSTLTKDYVPGFIVLLKSILKNNPGICLPYIIFNEGNLDEKDIKTIKQIYSNITVCDINKKRYKNLKFSGMRQWRINPGNRFEIFTIKNFEKIIFLDVDMICRGSIQELLDFNLDFGACHHPMIKEEIPHIGFNDGFNCGVMLINKKFLNKKFLLNAYNTAKKYSWLGNQATFNIIFKKHLTLLPQKYFITTSFLSKEKLNSAIFLHFVGNKKPWFNKNFELKENYDDFVLNEDLGAISADKYLALKAALREYKMYL